MLDPFPVLSWKLTWVLAALVQLARLPDDQRLSAAELARRLDCSDDRVQRMLQPLVEVGLVASAGRHHGGYRLARPAAQIDLADLLTQAARAEGQDGTCPMHGACRPRPCAMHAVWTEATARMEEVLRRMTLAELAAGG